jgi:hypothetical protein
MGSFSSEVLYVVANSLKGNAIRNKLPEIASYSTEIRAVYQSNFSPTAC